MKETHAVLIDRIKRTQAVESFRFLPDDTLVFKPGQFLQVIFDEADRNNKMLNKYLSISSSPTKSYIELTKRLSDSDFSKRLNGLKVNDKLLLKAPLGTVAFKDEYRKIGFLIGGIGVTPAVSIIEYIMDKGLNTDVKMLYSNKAEEEMAFKKELDHWQAINCNIRVFYTVTDSRPLDPRCIFGYVTKGLLMANIPDFKERLFFIFGPPKMVDAMKPLCMESGVANENIKTESFLGY